MTFDITSIVRKMLTESVSNIAVLYSQISDVQYQIDKECKTYKITFEQATLKEERLNGMIRMDAYDSLHEVYIFELTITNGTFTVLTITKHNDTEERNFELQDIVFDNILLSYDIQFFDDLTYLPIGTIVSLEKGIKKMMIYGRNIKNGTDNKRYEYVGCFYPEGIRDFERVFLFDAKQITKVHFIGMQGMEETHILQMIRREQYE